MWTANPDGSGRQKVAQATGNTLLASPAWSSDGRLAFVEGKATVGIVSGAAGTKVTLPFLEVESLGWSPDGARFVVVGLRKGTAVSDVYTVRTDGTGLRRLTKNLEAYSVSWR